MAEHSIRTSILSLTAPGCTILHGSAAIALARAVNESAAAIRDSDPSSFGFFAALPPLWDGVDGEKAMAAALAEITYALDVLHADGVTLYTRYGPGNMYLGHELLKPVWALLSARRTVVLVHPTHTVDPVLINAHLPQPIIDYPHETTRAAVDLIMNNRLHEFPGCKIILSHAGGTLPYLAARAAHMLPDYGLIGKPATKFLDDARVFYYDVALSMNAATLGLLRGFVAPERILFGTDFPYAPRKTIATNVTWLDEQIEEMGGKETAMLERRNAEWLFPRLRLAR